MAEEQELAGKVAVVTGASRNIGRAIALDLARGGASILVNARSNKSEAEATLREIEKLGARAAVFIADVTDAGAVGKMAADAARRFGRIDILVNNAAVRTEAAIDTLSFEEWRRITGIILDGAFHCVKACLPHLRQSGAGSIVNIGGLTGHIGAKGRAHVVTAKAGLAGMTKALAHDLADSRITVNCVSPGLIETVREGQHPHHHLTSKTLAGRSGRPEEIAAAVRFLAGPKARYITGQTIHINGGAYLA